MKVEQVTLRNFRNVKDTTIYPDPGVNFLVGPNGQGKTSLIEALGFLSTFRSFRDAQSATVIQWGTIKSDISCILTSDETESGIWKTKLQITFQTTSQVPPKSVKTAYVNEKPFRSSTAYLSQRFGSSSVAFHSVIFNPSDHDLVRSDPATRRAFLDRALAAEDFQYLAALQKYKRILDQRNALLKSSENLSSELLGDFTGQLCKMGSYLTRERLKWLQRLAEPLQITHQNITSGPANTGNSQGVSVRLLYVSNWAPFCNNLSFNNNKLQSIHFTGQGELPSLELLEHSFRMKAKALEAAERRSGFSLVGPHRDDWTFILGDQVLKGHGSQGEVRSVLLALKLAEIELFRNKTGHRPVFLLDDFSSELDRHRRFYLMDFLRQTDLQTFVTTTEDTSFLGKRYRVSNGSIEEGRHD